MKMNKLVSLCMMVAVVIIAFGVCASSSYGQAGDCSTFAYCNPTTGYEINSVIVIDEPNNDTTNLAVGAGTLVGNTSSFDTAVGNLALENNTTGEFNTATGQSALQFNTTGPHNTADGSVALVNTTTGGDNTASGYSALFSNTTGSGNTASGYRALTLSTGGNNSALGYQACLNVTTAKNVICIGSGVAGANASNSTYIAGIFGRPTTGANNPEVCVDKFGKLGTTGCRAPVQQEVINQQQQIQTQGQQIADLQQRLSQLESLIAKK
jgi:hypothetical protein